MKRLKKFGAIICAIAMIVSSITYYPTNNVSAATYDSLTYTTLDSNLSYCIVSQNITGWATPFYGDGGATFQLSYSADNKKADTKISINGTETTSGAVTFYDQGIVKVNPQLFEDNAYTEMVVTTTTGSATIVFKITFGPDMDAVDPKERNSNLLPVKANGDVLFLSVVSFGICGNTVAPMDISVFSLS